MMRTSLSVVALVALGAMGALSGCTSDDGGGGTAVSTASVTPSPGTPLPGTPQAEWVTLVAHTTTGVTRAFLSWEDWDCQAATVDTNCVMVLASIGFSAEALATSIHGGGTPGSDTFVGEPPAELADLVTQTEAAATVLSESATTAGTSCAAAGATCPSDAAAALAAYDDLEAQFAAWTPYGG